MPRGQKSKLRAREKRCQARMETKDLGDAQAAASPTPTSGSTPPGSPTAGAGQNPQGAAATSSPVAGASRPRSKAHARRQAKQRRNSSQVSIFSKPAPPDPLTKKAGVLMHFMLEKFKMQEPIKKIDMLKVVHKMFKAHFPEILKKAAERIELIFGLELKEVKPNGHSYTLVCKEDLAKDGVLGSTLEVPKNGLLMPLLSVIFLNGNCASEADVWEFLNILGIYDGNAHIIFGEPRKFITEELVQEKYLIYRQIPDSDPPSCEFVWGPRAHAETTKMKVLEFVAKINNTVPSAFPFHYEEALRDEEERAKARSAARARGAAKAIAHSKAPPSNPSSPQ
nr:melanoma-associated antigen B1-like [Odocoileus virginianus texanus]XP_020726698.1 melanoma-associated antigen B1-like [Odocoileus virginianus texanus]XP_020726699.1 melanoma-associated antigen B1-like [Odocoileus virginianus texanus]